MLLLFLLPCIYVKDKQLHLIHQEVLLATGSHLPVCFCGLTFIVQHTCVNKCLFVKVNG